MTKDEMNYRINKIENMLTCYTTVGTDINLQCCMEEVVKILKELVERV